jgi:AraC-like DNA-binding protein
LGDHVRCIWTLRGAGGGVERVLPDGCCEIVLNRGDPFRHDGREQPRSMVVGQLPRFLVIEPQGAIDLVGIRFRPGGLYPFLGVPMHELTDRWADLRDVDRGLKRDLEGARGIEAALLTRLRPRDRVAAAAAAAIERGERRMDRVAEGLGLSPRRLERLFRREVGLPPKALSAIARFQGALRAAGRGSWAAIAQTHGYYDQAHLIRDFRRLAGLPPSAYLTSDHAMSDAFTGG